MKRSVQCLLLLGLFTLFFSAQASAASNNLVIAHVQAGGTSGVVSAAAQEFITVYNNSSVDVEITNWCVTNKSNIAFACMKPTTNNQTFYLPAHQYMTIVSTVFSQSYPEYQADIIYTSSGAVTAGSDTITLKDASGNEMDIVSWTSANSLTGGTILQRQMMVDSVMMQDTDLPADFIRVKNLTLPIGGVYEVVTIVDQCGNIPDVQHEIPVGYMLNEYADCVRDSCSNLDGLQESVPEDFLRRESDVCVYDYVQLRITELLPNVSGSDDGKEYIEVYNPSDRDAFLIHYVLSIGDKMYYFPAGLRLGPGQYMAFYNNEITFTLVNTTSRVTLLGDDESIISQTDMYDNPKDDMAWALIGDSWQFTNQVTFAAANIASIFAIDEEDETAGLSPCATNQYRHPETNRCRLLITVAAAAPCKDGQYRSEETNRCRTIALAGGTLTPCREDQYRSEETNRCRNLTTLASVLTPCKDNQYRSEETNRCRTVAPANAPAAAFAVEPIADMGTAFVGWWALGGIGTVALGYAAWEWRLEMMAAVRRALSFFTQR